MPSPSLLLLLVLAQSPAPAPASETTGIEDNSFLVEEAYNQERGIVQHISTFAREKSGDWLYTFTQEWPVNAAPRHQLSYTVALLSAGERAGFGDAWINWRYQSVNSPRLAVSPRVSVSLPTGDSTESRGAGGAGLQFNLPISVRAHDGEWEFHSNAGATFHPEASDPEGHHARSSGVTLAQSAVWRMRPVFNALCEVVFNRQEEVVAEDTAVWGTSLVINPGIRWAHNLANGTQIVPGVSVPVDTKRPAGEKWSVFAYLSIEHPFGRNHE